MLLVINDRYAPFTLSSVILLHNKIYCIFVIIHARYLRINCYLEIQILAEYKNLGNIFWNDLSIYCQFPHNFYTE